MALASSANGYGTIKLNEKNKQSEKISASKNLDFYESMYHFKKMFPKFDPEVIETVLRSNDGAVDRTVDQLLAMSIDNECVVSKVVDDMFVDLSVISDNNNDEFSQTESSKITSKVSLNTDFNDSPPSYNEFLALKMAEKSITNDKFEKSVVLIDEKTESINLTEPKPNSNLAYHKPQQINVAREISLMESKSKVLIGELPNSFLRIKLTTDQVKKFKTTIKKAKRNEITAILNNKPISEKPPVSREIKKKLNLLNEQMEEPKKNEFNENEDWQSKYNTVTKTYENRRIQIIQDEYIAKLMQNEEFLNEIKKNTDFMQSLNSEESGQKINDNTYSNKILRSSEKHVELSNAELKSKLLKMGKASKLKLAKLGTAFSTMHRNKYRQAVEQSHATCSSIFSEHKTHSPLDEEDDSYTYKSTNYNEFDNSSNKPTSNRYQKAYKSFKSVLRRNSSSTSTPIGLSIKSTEKQRNSLAIDDFFDKPKFDEENINKRGNGDLIVFDKGYSYDNDNEANIQYDYSTYDFSTYPYTKTTKQTKSFNKN